MGDSGGTQVDPVGLRQVAGVVQQTSVGVRKAFTARHGLVPAATAGGGWACVAAARAASAAWGAFVGQLSDDVRGFGEGLRAAADGYQASDRAAGDRVAGAGRGPR